MFSESSRVVDYKLKVVSENAAYLRRICKRSDQRKIERVANNDARLILSRKLDGAMI